MLTSSLVGVPAHGCAGAAAYAASKAYLRSFGNALHDELKKRQSLCNHGAARRRRHGLREDGGHGTKPGLQRARRPRPGRRVGAGRRGARRAHARRRGAGARSCPASRTRPALCAAELLPNVVGRVVAKATFAPAPRGLSPRGAFIAAPARSATSPPRLPPSRSVPGRAVGYGLLGVVGGLSVANALQDGSKPPLATAPPYASKADFYAAWRASIAPEASTLPGSVWDGELSSSGRLHLQEASSRAYFGERRVTHQVVSR